MEEIIKSITEAEAEAEKIKLNAQEKSAQIFAEAERHAAEISASSQEECRLKREMSIVTAEKEAEKQYLKTVEAAAAKAKAYADEVVKHSDKQINEIVGRICGGNR